MRKSLVLTLLIAMVVVWSFCGGAVAADFPTKPIKLIVGFRAGGSIDTMGRIIAEEMSKELGQPVVVQNKTGGGSNLASTFVKNDKPDGYTISAVPSQLVVMNPKAMKTKYTADDFAYIGAGAMFQEAFVALADKPYNDFMEMIAWAKKNNKKLRYASMIPQDISIAREISKDTGVTILPVPTKGGAAIMTSVLGGHVDFGFSGGVHYTYVKAGKMKVLMAVGTQRLTAFPDVPTIIEMGWDMPIDNYMMIFLRKEVPASIQKTLADAVAKAFQCDKFKEVVDKLNMVPVYLDPDQCVEQIEKTKAISEKFEF